MTDPELERRNADLENALENLLEAFEDIGGKPFIEVILTTSDGTEVVPMECSPEVAELVEVAEELLFGGSADAEEG